jgi:hypothetical protein
MSRGAKRSYTGSTVISELNYKHISERVLDSAKLTCFHAALLTGALALLDNPFHGGTGYSSIFSSQFNIRTFLFYSIQFLRQRIAYVPLATLRS